MLVELADECLLAFEGGDDIMPPDPPGPEGGCYREPLLLSLILLAPTLVLPVTLPFSCSDSGWCPCMFSFFIVFDGDSLAPLFSCE